MSNFIVVSQHTFGNNSVGLNYSLGNCFKTACLGNPFIRNNRDNYILYVILF